MLSWGDANRRKRLRVGLVLAGLYGLLGCAALYPVPLDPTDRIVGGGELGGWLWRYWFMKLELAALWAETWKHPVTFLLQVISLGRFPETGNIADLYLISLPLEALFGHPAYYNIKCLLILVANGLAGYALARHFTPSRTLGFLGGTVAAFNSFVFLELYQSGLRQAILWWLLLSVLFLERVLEKGETRDGVLAGVFFGMTAAFYWFYGLFLAMFSVVRGLTAVPGLVQSERRRRVLASAAILILVGLAIAYVFAYPYIYIKTDHTGALPEVQWFAPFPPLDRLLDAPMTPHTLEENLLASLARVLVSSWTLDYLWNPLHPRNVPIMLGLLALGLGLVRIRKEWFWLAVTLFFWLHTGGPYLQTALHGGERTYFMLGDEPLKLPYYYTFQVVPLMSRLFAPYRSAAMVWIGLAVLLVRNLEALRVRFSSHERAVALVLGALVPVYLGQYFLDGAIVAWLEPDEQGLSGRGLPVDSSIMRVHPFYHALAREPGRIGIIEVPVREQQDLVNYYQVIHQKKLFRGWALPGALPPVLRYKHRSTLPETRRLMWIVEPDTPAPNSFADALERMNQPPYVLRDYTVSDRDELGRRGFKYLILHERGCYVLLPSRGTALYETLKRRLAKHLGEHKEFVELVAPDDPEFGQIDAGVLGEWASSALPGGGPRPTRFRMTVFRMPGYQGP